jgi:hypothetical protein
MAQARERREQFRARDQPTWQRELQAAYVPPERADAKRALDHLHRELRLLNESAAASLAEGLDEVLTLHRLTVFPELGVSFQAMNLLGSLIARLEANSQRLTRWRARDQKLRQCASALWATQRQSRCVIRHRKLLLLEHALQHTLSLAHSELAPN